MHVPRKAEQHEQQWCGLIMRESQEPKKAAEPECSYDAVVGREGNECVGRTEAEAESRGKTPAKMRVNMPREKQEQEFAPLRLD